jgi:RecQ family ATP-dependent DNA helicase
MACMDNVILQIVRNLLSPGETGVVSTVIDEEIQNVLKDRYGEDWEETCRVPFIECKQQFKKPGGFRLENYEKDVPYYYLAYYLPMNIPRIQLSVLYALQRSRTPSILKVLDLGCGPGTASIALIDILSLIKQTQSLFGANNQSAPFEQLELTLLDGSRENLLVANTIIDHVLARLRGCFREKDVIRTSDFQINLDSDDLCLNTTYDIIIISNVLNELSDRSRQRVILQASNHLNSEGLLIVLEPATEWKVKAMNLIKQELPADMLYLGPCSITETCSDCWVYQSQQIVPTKTVQYCTASEGISEKGTHWAWAVFQKSNEIAQDRTPFTYFVIDVTDQVYRLCDGKGVIYTYKRNPDKSLPLRFGDEIQCDTEPDINQDRITKFKGPLLINGENITENHTTSYSIAPLSTIEFFFMRYWGYHKLRDGQFEIIQNAILGKDTLGILPTGAGKSLCFQLPAMLKTGVSIVVSPLKSLIHDQIEHLRKAGITYVDYIDSSNHKDHKGILLRLKHGRLKIIYVTPERLQQKSFRRDLKTTMKNVPVDYLIIDEAHCISEWGHDFRPAYLNLYELVEVLENPIIISLTATASNQVRDDILRVLHIPQENVLLGSMDRPELSLEVQEFTEESDLPQILMESIQKRIPSILDKNVFTNPDCCGLIFSARAKNNTYTNQTAEGICTDLKKCMEDAEIDPDLVDFYHAKEDDNNRILKQTAFIESRIRLLVATKAFGMGIDKSNIDFVIHVSFAGSLEGYYQEAGRAGRDGEHAHSIILFQKRAEECKEQCGNSDSIPCLLSKGCPFAPSRGKCSFSQQMYFIKRSYKDYTLESINEFIKDKFQNLTQSEFSLSLNSDSKSKAVTYLYALKQQGIVDYFEEDGNEVRVGLKRTILNETEVTNCCKKILAYKQERKQSRINMLVTMNEYCENPNHICRREFLMAYLTGTAANYGGNGCHFCDVEGISAEKAMKFSPTARIRSLFKDLDEMLHIDQNNLSAPNVSQIYDFVESALQNELHEQIRIRCLRWIEDYPLSKTAHLVIGFIELRNTDLSKRVIHPLQKSLNLALEISEFNLALIILEKIWAAAEGSIDIIDYSELIKHGILADFLAGHCTDKNLVRIFRYQFYQYQLSRLINEVRMKTEGTDGRLTRSN